MPQVERQHAKKLRKGEEEDKNVPVHSIWDEGEKTSLQVQGLSTSQWDRAYNAYEDRVAGDYLAAKGRVLEKGTTRSHRRVCELVDSTNIRLGDCQELRDLEVDVKKSTIAPTARGQVTMFQEKDGGVLPDETQNG